MIGRIQGDRRRQKLVNEEHYVRMLGTTGQQSAPERKKYENSSLFSATTSGTAYIISSNTKQDVSEKGTSLEP